MAFKDTYSVEYEFTREGGDHNPRASFVLDIDYVYTAGHPDRLTPPPGEPGWGPEVDMTATLWLLDGAARVALPHEIHAWLIARIELADFFDAICTHAEEGRESSRIAAAEARAESQMEGR